MFFEKIIRSKLITTIAKGYLDMSETLSLLFQINCDFFVLSETCVVYFDQQVHACAFVRMVENDRKHSKMMIKVPFPSCVREAHVRLMKNI